MSHDRLYWWLWSHISRTNFGCVVIVQHKYDISKLQWSNENFLCHVTSLYPFWMFVCETVFICMWLSVWNIVCLNLSPCECLYVCEIKCILWLLCGFRNSVFIIMKHLSRGSVSVNALYCLSLYKVRRIEMNNPPMVNWKKIFFLNDEM